MSPDGRAFPFRGWVRGSSPSGREGLPPPASGGRPSGFILGSGPPRNRPSGPWGA